MRVDRRLRFDTSRYSLAIANNNSAWHGSSSGHQHARFFPRNCARMMSGRNGEFTSPCVSSPVRNARSNSFTAVRRSGIPGAPGRNGLPNCVVRSTFTVFGGMCQPLRRLSCTRCGVRELIGVAQCNRRAYRSRTTRLIKLARPEPRRASCCICRIFSRPALASV